MIFDVYWDSYAVIVSAGSMLRCVCQRGALIIGSPKPHWASPVIQKLQQCQDEMVAPGLEVKLAWAPQAWQFVTPAHSAHLSLSSGLSAKSLPSHLYAESPQILLSGKALDLPESLS